MKSNKNLNKRKFNDMTFEEFDQSPNGCRKLADSGKLAEAALAIIDYLKANNLKLNAYQKCLLNWHAGQAFAKCGKKDLAIQYFNIANKDKENMFKIFGPATNYYFNATIAFLNNDRELVERQLQEIMKIPIKSYPPTNVVLIPGLVHNMFQNPNKSYKDLIEMRPSLPPFPGENYWHVIIANNMEEEGKLVGEYRHTLDQLLNANEMKSPASLSGTAQTATLLGVTPSALATNQRLFDKKDILTKPTSDDVDVTDEEMARSAFGQGSNTARKLTH